MKVQIHQDGLGYYVVHGGKWNDARVMSIASANRIATARRRIMRTERYLTYKDL